MNEVDLIPCPFCGGEAVDTYNTKHGYIIFCENENCMMNQNEVGFETLEQAINSWNTRKPMDEGIEKLKEEMVFYEQIKKETEEKDYRYLYHKIAEAYGKAVVIMHKSKWQEKGE